jgi:hypothetical protein
MVTMRHSLGTISCAHVSHYILLYTGEVIAHLHGTISHLKETRTTAKDSTRSNHLSNSLSRRTNNRPNKKQKSTSQEEVPSPKDIRKSTTDRHENSAT